jgi:hypothetical protein
VAGTQLHEQRCRQLHQAFQAVIEGHNGQRARGLFCAIERRRQIIHADEPETFRERAQGLFQRLKRNAARGPAGRFIVLRFMHAVRHENGHAIGARGETGHSGQ